MNDDRLPATTYEHAHAFRAYQPGEFYFQELSGRGNGRLFATEE